jgi:hypothetical protein
MKTSLLFKILLLLLFVTEVSIAQNNLAFNFDSLSISVTRNSSTDIIIPISISYNLDNYKDSADYLLNITPLNETTLPTSDYELSETTISFKNLIYSEKNNYTFYLKIKKDNNNIQDVDRKIVFQLRYIKKGISNIIGDKLSIIVNHKPNSLNEGFNYLVYLGTNFDLVDGQKTNNLFFASNVFLRPEKKHVGMYLSLYGNRTMTTTDTFNNLNLTTKLVKINDSSYYRINEKSSMIRSLVSDNLGAYVSPLIRLSRASDLSNSLQLYYSPSLEFVWRRTNSVSTYSGSNSFDTTTINGYLYSSVIEFPNKVISNFNEYVFNAGLIGFLVTHQSNEISVRVHGSVGFSSTYSPSNSSTNNSNGGFNYYTSTKDIFFTGRAWITEASTGITLQAEITNSYKYSRPFYGVTISKAINFKNLGNLLKPVNSL